MIAQSAFYIIEVWGQPNESRRLAGQLTLSAINGNAKARTASQYRFDAYLVSQCVGRAPDDKQPEPQTSGRSGLTILKHFENV